MFKSNYHTHTKRCGHAYGEDEDYVLEALGYGIHDLGFSDHVILPGFSEPGMRGDYSLFNDYVNSIRSLQRKYKDQMNLYLGFEAESFPQFFPYYKEILDNGLIDYLILGNHMAMGNDNKIHTWFVKINTAEELYLYKDLAVQALSTGMFSIFAHPDIFMSNIENFDADCKKVSKILIETAMAYDVPLEINIAGIRNGERQYGNKKRRRYPTDEFFSLVSKYKAKCVFGSDAHAPENISNDSANYTAVQFAKKHDLNIIDKVDKIKQH